MYQVRRQQLAWNGAYEAVGTYYATNQDQRLQFAGLSEYLSNYVPALSVGTP